MKSQHYNVFLEYLYGLWDTILEEDPYREETKYKLSIFGNKEKAYTVNEIEQCYHDCMIFAESLEKNPPSFDYMWEFCEFVRVAEKVLFYHNKPENVVYVEMNLSDLTAPRKMRIRHLDTEIRFTLEHSVLHSDIISINILRNFGLNMETKYKIVDGDLGGYKDNSDLYMINEINRLLEAAMYTTFTNVINGLCNNYKYLKTMDWYVDLRYKEDE